MSKHPPRVTFLFVKCVTYKSIRLHSDETQDTDALYCSIIVISGTTLTGSHHFTHLKPISMTIKHTETETGISKLLRLSNSSRNVEHSWMLIIWQFGKHPWNDLSNSGILSRNQTLSYVITNLMNSSAWPENGFRQTRDKELFLSPHQYTDPCWI